MSLGFDDLVTEVKSFFGATSGDAIFTTTRVGRIVNDSIRQIIRKNKNLYDAGTLNKTALITVTGQYSYDLSVVATADSVMAVGSINRLKFVNSTLNQYTTLQPYVGGLDEWDQDMPNLDTWGSDLYDITALDHTANPDTITVAEDLSGFTPNFRIRIQSSTNNNAEYTVDSLSGTGPTTLTLISTDGLTDSTIDGTVQIAAGNGSPKWYVRRRNTIEIYPVPQNSFTGKPIWIDYDRLPNDIASSATPLLTDFVTIIIEQSVGTCFLQLRRNAAEAQKHYAISEGFLEIRLESEVDADQTNQMADHSP